MRALGGLVLAVWLCACEAVATAPTPATSTPAPAVGSPTATISAPRSATPAPTRAPMWGLQACEPDAACNTIVDTLNRISLAKMNDHLLALTGVGSRDPRHPGHAKAVAYIKEQLGALAYYGWKIESQRTVYQGIPLENIFASIEGATAAWSGSIIPPLPPSTTSILVSAHYDSIANRTPGWRPALDPAPGADDNATGTAALLEFARVISQGVREQLRSRIVLAFFDGEELFFKGSGAYVSSLEKPYRYKAAINLDMVGFNPLADRLDLLWYTDVSAGLRDEVMKANRLYSIGISPLNPQFAMDGNTIMDAAPFGLAGIPSIALCQRYGDNDSTFPGNYTFHTVNDTPDKITNARLWLKAAKLTLATALELAR
ncbi:MAG: M28 family peptidase [Chloroflexi bacterium]|nr:MAG: M28 family peptidase [Chloroflexota bacterium]